MLSLFSLLIAFSPGLGFPKPVCSAHESKLHLALLARKLHLEMGFRLLLLWLLSALGSTSSYSEKSSSDFLQESIKSQSIIFPYRTIGLQLCPSLPHCSFPGRLAEQVHLGYAFLLLD